MRYPLIEVDYNKFSKNIKSIKGICDERGISVAGVTKVFCAYREIAKAYCDCGLSYLADSRILNLKKLEDFKIEKMLIRIPMISEAKDVVRYSDISLNSEYKTILSLDEEAKKINKIHNIILMLDLGDLREGYFKEEDLYIDIEKIIKLKNIKIVGLGANLTCFGGVLPDEENMGRLASVAEKIRQKFNLKLEIVSGGNSSAISMVSEGRMNKGINNLRIGEAFVLGRETAYGKQIEGTNEDAFILKAEVVEVKEKPSVPIGERGMDAFGHVPEFEDRGIRNIAILAIGKQDVSFRDLTPVNKDIRILGSSSDHLVIDVTESKERINVSDIVEFKLNYGGVLSLMTSNYVNKAVKYEDTIVEI